MNGFRVRLICCNVAEPSRENTFATWEEADAYRRDWEESGKADTAIGDEGHERRGIIWMHVDA